MDEILRVDFEKNNFNYFVEDSYLDFCIFGFALGMQFLFNYNDQVLLLFPERFFTTICFLDNFNFNKKNQPNRIVENFPMNKIRPWSLGLNKNCTFYLKKKLKHKLLFNEASLYLVQFWNGVYIVNILNH